jgi:flagellar hook-length control protein FliK
VIAITAYSEPVTSNVCVNEPSQVQENEENENNSKHTNSFAEILAGLLNTSIAPVDVQTTGEELSLELTGAHFENSFDIDPSETLQTGFELTEENPNIFLNTDNLFSNTLEMETSAEETDLAAELLLKEITLQKDISSLVKEKTAADTPAGLTAASETAKQNINEAFIAEMADRKKSAAGENQPEEKVSKTEKTASENAQAISLLKKSGEENDAHNRQKENSSASENLDELRNRSRRDRFARSSGTLEIRDLKTMIDMSQTRAFMSLEAAVGRTPGASVQDITLELRLPDFNNAGQSAQTTWDVKAANALENMLARELHQNFNGDIVRHASMALREGGESTIRLALRPESLGNVKIHLEMTDNKITGYILVESEEAMNAFRKELASLEQAFKDSGFADASLDLSFASDGQNAWQEHEENAVTSRIAALGYEDFLREAETDALTEALFDVFGQRLGSINMLA